MGPNKITKGEADLLRGFAFLKLFDEPQGIYQFHRSIRNHSFEVDEPMSEGKRFEIEP
jgi:hypothetical protein